MKRRLIICAGILAVAALVWFIPDFSNTRAKRYNDARAAAQRELETIDSLVIERILVERGDRLEPKLAAQFFAAKSARTAAINAGVWQSRRAMIEASNAEAQAEIGRQLAAIDRQIESHAIAAKEAIRLQKSLAPEK